MKKILFMGIAILLVIGLVAGGTFAYFSDTETSEGNVIQAGTIDLAVNNENPWSSGLFEFIDIKPCMDLGVVTVKFQNVGNNEGVLYFSIIYVEDDKYGEPEPPVLEFEFTSDGNPGMEMSADQFAGLVYVAAVTHQYFDPGAGSIHDDLPKWMGMDLNGDSKVSLYELFYYSPIAWATNQGDTLPSGEASQFVITFHLAHAFETSAGSGTAYTGDMDVYGGTYTIYQGSPVVWNVPQADGISVTVTGDLYQVGPEPA